MFFTLYLTENPEPTEDTVHRVILQMYTEECFVYKTLNKYLRE